VLDDDEHHYTCYTLYYVDAFQKHDWYFNQNVTNGKWKNVHTESVTNCYLFYNYGYPFF